MSHAKNEVNSLLARVRVFVLALFLLGSLGTGAELFLLEHTEEAWQWAPLALLISGVLVALGYAILRRLILLRVFQMLMLLFVLSGGVGSVLHYRAKVEFKLEMQPDLGGWQLFQEVMHGATLPPVLAPGVMLQLGLLGLIYCYRHSELIEANATFAHETRE